MARTNGWIFFPGAAACQGHVFITSDLPRPIDNGFHVLPKDSREAVRFITERGTPRIKEFRGSQLLKLQESAGLMTPNLNEIRDGIDIDHLEARARFRIASLEELLSAHDMGGGEFA